MTYGKTIEIFLEDGTTEGVVTAELSNWNGKAIKIPRTLVAECTRPDIQGVGVYFLFCIDEQGNDAVYIGESENILKRLKQHIRDYKNEKESYYWNTAVAFVGRDLNKAHICYLENRLVQLAHKYDRNQVLTQSTSQTTLKESQIASMEEFLSTIETLMGVLGYKVLTPMPQANNATEYLYCSGNGARAKGFLSSGGFTVLKDSIISNHVTNSFRKQSSYYTLREQLITQGVIKEDKFLEEYEFSAPSAASGVVLGRTSNGNKDWKTMEGVPLGNL